MINSRGGSDEEPLRLAAHHHATFPAEYLAVGKDLGDRRGRERSVIRMDARGDRRRVCQESLAREVENVEKLRARKPELRCDPAVIVGFQGHFVSPGRDAAHHLVSLPFGHVPLFLRLACALPHEHREEKGRQDRRHHQQLQGANGNDHRRKVSELQTENDQREAQTSPCRSKPKILPARASASQHHHEAAEDPGNGQDFHPADRHAEIEQQEAGHDDQRQAPGKSFKSPLQAPRFRKPEMEAPVEHGEGEKREADCQPQSLSFDPQRCLRPHLR